MKEMNLQKCNFRCRENIYICRPLRRLWRLAVEYVKNFLLNSLGLEIDVWALMGGGGVPLPGDECKFLYALISNGDI